MKVRKALDHFKRMASETSSKAEIKIFDEFIRILTSLEEKGLSATEIEKIENELTRLKLDTPSSHTKKYYTKALSQFESYLKDTFSLTTKGHYTKIGIALGMTFGLLFGIVVLSNLERSTGIALGISIGMLSGLVIGRHLDDKTLSSGKAI